MRLAILDHSAGRREVGYSQKMWRPCSSPAATISPWRALWVATTSASRLSLATRLRLIRRQIRSVCFGQRGAGLGVSCRDRGDAALRKSGKAVRPACGYPTGPNDTDSKCAQWGSLEQRKMPTVWKRWAFSVGEC